VVLIVGAERMQVLPDKLPTVRFVAVMAGQSAAAALSGRQLDAKASLFEQLFRGPIRLGEHAFLGAAKEKHGPALLPVCVGKLSPAGSSGCARLRQSVRERERRSEPRMGPSLDALAHPAARGAAEYAVAETRKNAQPRRLLRHSAQRLSEHFAVQPLSKTARLRRFRPRGQLVAGTVQHGAV